MITGDIAQNKFVILPIGTQSTIKSWLAVLDKTAELKPSLILPDHSPQLCRRRVSAIWRFGARLARSTPGRFMSSIDRGWHCAHLSSSNTFLPAAQLLGRRDVVGDEERVLGAVERREVARQVVELLVA